jgi:hypothetical protein
MTLLVPESRISLTYFSSVDLIYFSENLDELTALIPDGSKYPHAAAIIQPTNNPITTADDFIIGDPSLSQIRMVTNTENPRPIYSALPQGRACGEPTLGQSIYAPEVGREMHDPEPPSQSSNPLWMSETPISMTVGPVTIGGKIFRIIFGGMKEIRTRMRAQQALVPIRAP